MNIYKVGGCVRDNELGLKPKDIDYVVIDSSVDEMLNLGYEQVGKSFPVFLHPETKDEYALARKEISTGHGYDDFEFITSSVSLEEDLFRRDLTINSMAYDDHGNLIDPYNGLVDLKAGIIRHTSYAFAEDPVRILRACRFAARYNFDICDETMQLMKSMVDNGQVDCLILDRTMKELLSSLNEKYSYRFIEYMEECGALQKVFQGITSETTELRSLSFALPNLLTKYKYALMTKNINFETHNIFRSSKTNTTTSVIFNMVRNLLRDEYTIEDVLEISDMVNARKIPDRFFEMFEIFRSLGYDVDYLFECLDKIRVLDQGHIAKIFPTNIREAIILAKLDIIKNVK